MLNKTPEGAENPLEIVSARVLDAPRAAVFEAFSDPDRLARWWGPAGFTNRFEVFELRPGGAFRFTMRGPDGAEYPMDKQFTEVAAPERIVLRHLSPVHHRFTMTMTFADLGERTRVEWRMVFDSDDEARAVREPILAANEQNFDRLAAHLRGSAR